MTAVVVAGALLAVPALGANRYALRDIVLDQCMVHWVRQHTPAPCERVSLAGPGHELSGYAVLADRKGGAHFLLIPTWEISGIESPALLEPGTVNYFSAAWAERDRLDAVVGHLLPRTAVGLAVNPRHARSQDQLHIHIECLSPDVAETVNRSAERITTAWSRITIRRSSYAVLRIPNENLDGANPFHLLADRMTKAGHVMGDFTLIVAGMQFTSGPGFILLAGTGPAGELLLDSTCAIAKT